MVIQKYLNFENFSCAVHFTLDQTGVLFLDHPVMRESLRIVTRTRSEKKISVLPASCDVFSLSALPAIQHWQGYVDQLDSSMSELYGSPLEVTLKQGMYEAIKHRRSTIDQDKLACDMIELPQAYTDRF